MKTLRFHYTRVEMTQEKKKAFLINVAYVALLFTLAYFVIKYVIFWLLPFFIGMLIAVLLKPLIVGICRVTKLNQKFVAVCVALLTYALLGVLIYFTGGILISQTIALVKKLPDFYTSTILPLIEKISQKIYDLPGSFDGEFRQVILNFLDMLSKDLNSLVSSSSGAVMEYLGKFALKIPNTIVSLIFTVIATFFFCTDYQRVINFLMLQLSKKGQTWTIQIKNTLMHTMAKLLYAYFLLFIITFAELAIGFFLLKIPYAATLAAIIALADFLPIIGTGAIVIPWVILELIRGNYILAIGLFVLYVIITIIRNIIEPKIVGKQIGLHPLVTLITMYIGLRFLGFTGLIVLPFTLIILKHLNENNVIHLWKDLKHHQPDKI